MTKQELETKRVELLKEIRNLKKQIETDKPISLTFTEAIRLITDGKTKFQNKNEQEWNGGDGRDGINPYNSVTNTYMIIGDPNKKHYLHNTVDIHKLLSFAKSYYNREIKDISNIVNIHLHNDDINRLENQLIQFEFKLKDVIEAIKVIDKSRGNIDFKFVADKIIASEVEFLIIEGNTYCKLMDKDSKEFEGYFITDENTYYKLIGFVNDYCKKLVDDFYNLKIMK